MKLALRTALEKCLFYFDGKPKYFIWFVVLILILLLGLAYTVTGPDINLKAFYLIPVAIVSWYVSCNSGYITSFACISIWAATNFTSEPPIHTTIAYWNIAAKGGMLLSLSWVVSELRLLLNRERNFSRTDFLTGLYNRRAFYGYVCAESHRAKSTDLPFSVVYIDLDNFKQVNEVYGHAAGDKVLVSVAETIREALRNADIAARLGGDEFMLLLPQADRETAKVVVLRLQQLLYRAAMHHNWPISASMGVLTVTQPPTSVDVLIRAGDRLMYSVKHHGKDGAAFACFPDWSSPQKPPSDALTDIFELHTNSVLSLSVDW